MRALDRSAAYVQGRTDPLLDLQILRSHGRADDVNHGIHGAHLVKMNLLDGGVVDFGLGGAQGLENANCDGLRGLANARIVDDFSNFSEAAAVTACMLVRRMMPGMGLVSPAGAT